jgi:DNA-binding MurR/RpiR family transcriptional regulator
VELAERTGLSSASVSRFAQRLGYEGYPHLQREIRAHLRSVFAPRVTPQAGLLEQFWQTEVGNLELLRHIPEAALQQAAQELASAAKIWIVAGRATQFVAQYGWYDLMTFRRNVHFVLSEHLGAMELAVDVEPSDVVLVYTIRRYAKATTRLVELWKRRGPKIILITDDGHPPVARLADQIIRVPIRSADGIPSLASLTSLTHALTMLTGQLCGEEWFERLEEIIKEADYYEY